MPVWRSTAEKYCVGCAQPNEKTSPRHELCQNMRKTTDWRNRLTEDGQLPAARKSQLGARLSRAP